MKTQSGGRGVIVMALDEGEALAAVAVPADDAVLAVEGSGRGGKALTIELKPAQREPLRHRRTQGRAADSEAQARAHALTVAPIATRASLLRRTDAPRIA